ncbi:site-specific recombinase [Ectothiorhodospira sp. PHS-1]|uniref:site-specific recombinase n=1 Tax=Ectothiorhodospira sp. PHS-1 TaxID=519989 RepID=UPI00024A83B5|nr:site-specific recombinase [Ectothiorhodospira sp. PHS-1]EHQ52746.1 site-specific recombinase [Ectothiorhodospira sp. PHS-1]
MECLADGETADLVEHLRTLVSWLRPRDPDDLDDTLARMEALTVALRENDELRGAILGNMEAALAASRHLPIYTEIGLFSRRGFLREFGQRFYELINPRPRDPGNLRDILYLVFDRPNDPRWVAAVPDEVWLALLDALEEFTQEEGPVFRRAREQVLYALEMLSLWVAGEELEPELLRLDPSMAERNSPFVAQEREVSAYIRDYVAWLEDPSREFHDDRHARVLLEQCAEQIERFQKRAVTRGSSIGLTHLITRLEQTLERITILLDLLDPFDQDRRRRTGIRLFKTLVTDNIRQTSLKALWQDNIRLVSRSVTEQSSRTGEHYITKNRREYLQMLGAAAGAGFIIAFMALIKIWLMKLGLSPGWETLWVSLNYGLGFVLIHILHFTVATKQPAMTAARLAAVIEAGERGNANQEKVADILIQVGRSQFVAVLGNVSVALPVAFLVGWVVLGLSGTPLLSADEVDYHLLDLQPLAGLALLHAAIAGVWLFLAGLIAGFFDNRCAYLQLGDRMKGNPHLAKVMSRPVRDRLAEYLDHNYGALAGNFLFGVLLGTTGLIGLWLSLPLDIRHVAFSSANLGYVASVHDLGGPLFLLYFVFVLLIGAVNLWVSFTLAMYVALRARGVRLGDIRRLARIYARQVRRHPLEVLLPPSEQPDAGRNAQPGSTQP